MYGGVYSVYVCVPAHMCILKNANKMKTHESITQVKNKVLLGPLKAPCVTLSDHNLPSPITIILAFVLKIPFDLLYSFTIYVCIPKQYIVYSLKMSSEHKVSCVRKGQ